MNAYIVNLLKERGYEPVIAHYEPYSVSPELSVPSYRLGSRKTGYHNLKKFEDCETHAIGAWLPELEFTHYLATKYWKELIRSCDFHIVVSGSAIPLLPFYQENIPCMAWVATGWAGDVEARTDKMKGPRRLLNSILIAPIMRAIEKRVLRHGNILALSEYTGRTLDEIAGSGVTKAILPMPIDTEFFKPQDDAVIEGRIGFSGRLNDVRKNVDLLLNAVGLLVKDGVNVSLDLIGGELDEKTATLIDHLDIKDHVNIIAYLTKDKLAKHLRSLDVYVVPSHQEGLCIAALEAMSCGCPVVSTRCGGPEEFVIDDQTGFLVGFDAGQMADAIKKSISERKRRAQLGAGARSLIEKRYNHQAASAVFWENFESVFAETFTGTRKST